MLEPGHKDIVVNCALYNPRSLNSLFRERRKQREVAATVPWHAAIGALTFRRSRVSACHGYVCTRLIYKHKLFRIELSNNSPPRRSRLGVLLRGC